MSDPLLLPSPRREWLGPEILAWQARVRAGVAACAGLVAFAAVLAGSVRWANGAAAALVAAGYAIGAIGTARVARQRRRASTRLRRAVAAADVLLVFVLTALLVGPEHYERAFVLSTFSVLLSQLFLGTRAALTAFRTAVVGYAVLLAWGMHEGQPIDWWGGVVDLALFGVGGGVVALVHASRQRRLGELVTLFGRLEEGDFTEAYDWRADARPDAISAVGRAYDRMRTQLAAVVLTDPLSGCVNRRGFDQQLARELARASRVGAPVSLVAVDIDHFKRVNDDFGHLAGDGVIRDVGALLRERARTGDVVARVGGEEFVLLLPDTDEAGAAALAERVVESVRSWRFAQVDGRAVTVSAGVAAVESVTDAGIAEALKGRADEALYAAKRGGRDRVKRWSALHPAADTMPALHGG